MLPAIFNVVMDAVVRTLVSLVAGGVGGPEGWGKEVLRCVTFIYTDNGLVVSTDPEWLQGAFDTLTGLFYRVGILTNVGKKVRML